MYRQSTEKRQLAQLRLTLARSVAQKVICERTVPASDLAGEGARAPSEELEWFTQITTKGSVRFVVRLEKRKSSSI